MLLNNTTVTGQIAKEQIELLDNKLWTKKLRNKQLTYYNTL